MPENTTERQYLIAVYFEGHAYYLGTGPGTAKSVFGGPSQIKISGVPGTIYEPGKLHHIGRVSDHDIPSLGRHLADVPLFYGLTFDGCTLRYEIESASKVNLLDLTPPRPTKDWPYKNYPTTLPLVPLRVRQKQQMSYSRFAAEFPKLEEHPPSDLVVAVPSATPMGVPIWGKYASEVTIVFQCDLGRATVEAYNVCD